MLQSTSAPNLGIRINFPRLPAYTVANIKAEQRRAPDWPRETKGQQSAQDK
ncbi:hypothetical protein DPMN_011975 [Dreissena polymorpha]|uniref:Uncharacterized protein n=1 Tax=Dreissena polymorpha TaxID=45954 RepID=A0A9D4S2E1_DREPO|nr:hypothetical protein DPMN_011975 [Dreissena polymorpha]